MATELADSAEICGLLRKDAYRVCGFSSSEGDDLIESCKSTAHQRLSAHAP
jgi:hypothetical protein